MPVQETSAKLWFETEEQKKAYDDLMVSNIELKDSDNPDSPHFSYLAGRSRKEKFPTYSQKYMEGFNKLAKIDNTSRYTDFSYRFWHEYTFEKYFMGIGLTYLFLRELPIRNFYARSLFMAAMGLNFYSNYRFRGLNSSVETNWVVDEDPKLGSKRFNTFHNVRSYLIGPKAMTDGKMSSYQRWKNAQPGFMDPDVRDFGKIGYLMTTPRETHWDGTFNQPILPLADVHSKHIKGYKFM